MVSMYLIYYLTDVLEAPTASLWWITGIIFCARIFDALNDPVMGLIVDNTRGRFGRFKPWIAFGAAASGFMTILIFSGFDLSKGLNIVLFGVVYVLWGVFYTVNDISYWSMLPALSSDQKERERIGAVARICANIGLFAVAAGILVFTEALGNIFGGLQKGYLAFAVIITAVLWVGQLVTLIGVKEPEDMAGKGGHTSIKELISVIIRNDQLLYTAISMALFMIGYLTTTSFATYYFKYAYGDVNMYTVFAIILGVAQITALAVFPVFSSRFERSALYMGAMAAVGAGYVLFFFASAGSILIVGIAGMLIFVGQAFIQLLMLMFLADSVDYGHWKLGRRNDSITFSLQPFINKMGGAVSSGVVSSVVIISGMKDAESAAEVSAGGVLLMKVFMFIFPLACILASYLLYKAKYRIDRKMYEYIVWELEQRKENQ
jgi:melibiose permease/lactose/raffinose/galactose permease